MLKAVALVGAATGALYAGGVFDSYPRTIDGTPAEVMAELADLDIREQPG